MKHNNMMLTKTLRIIYLILSVFCFCFLGLISLAGSHGHFNILALKSGMILLSGIYLITFSKNKSKINTLITIVIFLLAIYSFLSVILNFINVGNPRNLLQYKIFNISLYLGVIILITLFIKRITGNGSN